MKFEFSAGAIIYREDEKKGLLFLLLLKPNREYDIAKGHIEKGESAEVAAKREIREETGLEPEFLPYFSTSIKYFFSSRKQRVLKRVRIFIAKSGTEKVEISEEHIGYEWLSYQDVIRKIKFKDMRKLFEVAFDYINRYNEMQRINEEYSKLPEKDPKWGLSRRLVPGEGPLNAKVMCLGQAPGKNEDEQLRPFIGRSGQLLSMAIKNAKMKREEIYITSVVEFFPPENRMPTDEEIEFCVPFLMRQIGVIKPRFIIMLGSLSNRIVAGVLSVEKSHGRMVEREGIVYMTTFHPAAGLRFKRIHELILQDMKKFSDVIKAEKEPN